MRKGCRAGSAIRHSHELCTLTHRVMRFLIEQHGFRSVVLEGDEAASASLDKYVRTGEVSRSRFWLERGLFALKKSWAVGWIRARGKASDDLVCVAHLARHTNALMPTSPIMRTSSDAWQTPQSHGMNRPVTESFIGAAWRTLQTASLLAGTPAVILKNVSDRIRFDRTNFPSRSCRRSGPATRRLHRGRLRRADLDILALEISGSWSEPARGWLEAPAKTA